MTKRFAVVTLVAVTVLFLLGAATAWAAPKAKLPAVPEGWTLISEIPWGTGPGQLHQEIGSKDPRQVIQGPTRFVVFPGGAFAILDPIGAAVREYDAAGKFRRDLKFPANDVHDAETMTIDMAGVSPGEYWLLSLGQRALLHLTADGAVQAHPLAGLSADALLTAMTFDGRENLYVLDSMDNSVYRMNTAGKTSPKLTSDAAQNMIVDSAGRFYSLRLGSKTDLRHLEAIRWTPPDRVEVLGKLQTQEEANRMDVVGLDAKDGVYVWLAGGAIETPSYSEILRIGPDGSVTGRVPAPLDPTVLKLVHAKAVTPDGTLYAVTLSQTGFSLYRHDPMP
ncbi:MAG: hypothetical protein HY814_08810 [Candidatus Riflebacteria bacterium]|nr:hypothetical protein [Candidatus Riflebacteria bacterium]